jgi:hypothetical protein
VSKADQGDDGWGISSASLDQLNNLGNIQFNGSKIRQYLKKTPCSDMQVQTRMIELWIFKNKNKLESLACRQAASGSWGSCSLKHGIPVWRVIGDR